jgi:hypothetical protein
MITAPISGVTMRVIAVLIGLLLTAHASRTTSRRLTLAVGDVVEVDVDYKIGFACDDTKILHAWMVTRGQHNWFIVEGVEAGSTLCRVGTDPNLPSYLYEVVIEEKAQRRGGRRPGAGR